MSKVIAKKSNAVEIQRRIETIKIQLVDAKPYGTILHDGSRKWDISERQVADYIKNAKEQINTEFKPQRHMELQKHIARRERFLNLTMKPKKKDISLALRIDDSLARLKGLMVDNMLVPFEGKRLEIVDDK